MSAAIARNYTPMKKMQFGVVRISASTADLNVANVASYSEPLVDASSTKKASILTSYLRKTIGSLPIIPFVPDSSVNASMTHWALHGVDSDLLTLLYDIDLKELKDEGGNSKFRGVPLDSMEIQELLKSGWQVTKLGLSYDEQIAFSLAGDFIFKRLRTLERFQENLDTEDDPILQQQAELYLAVDLYRKMISHVYECVNSGG